MNFKQYLFLLFFAACSVCLISWKNDQLFGTIHGSVIDYQDNNPIVGATVELIEGGSSKILIIQSTDENGNFSFKKLKFGNYLLKVRYGGFDEEMLTDIKISIDSSDKEYNQIRLKRKTVKLEEATVMRSRSTIEHKIDRTVFNVSKDLTSDDASEILRKVPMVSVDSEGNPSIRGNRNVKILIDGKSTGSTNLGYFLQSIPGNQIQRIEVMTIPSAKYDGDGSGGTINIITRKESFNGFNSSLFGVIGTRQLNGNVNFSANFGKLSMMVSGGINNKFTRDIDITAYSYNNRGDSSTSEGNTLNSRYTNNTLMTLQYDIDSLHILSSTFRSTGLGYDDDMKVTNSNWNSAGSSIYTQAMKGIYKTSGFDWNSNFLWKFQQKSELDFSFLWSQNDSHQRFNNVFSGFLPNQRGDNKGINNEYTFQSDYRISLSNSLKLESGMKFINRNIKSDYDYWLVDENGVEQYDKLSSNKYLYTQKVFAAYLLLSYKIADGWDALIGSRYELTDINGDSRALSSKSSSFNNRYGNLLPNVSFMRKFSNGSSLKFGYSKRIQRPSLLYLNPFRNTSDPLNYSEGKPDLAPENVQLIEVGYNTRIKKVDFSTSLYYRPSRNIIESYSVPLLIKEPDGTGSEISRNISLTSFGNIGNNNAFGINLFGSASYTKGADIRFSLDMYNSDYSLNDEFSNLLNKSKFFQYYGFIGSSYTFPLKINLELSYNFESKKRTFQGSIPNLNIFNIGIKKEILKGNGSIGLAGTNIFKNDWNFTNKINSPTLSLYRNLATPFRSFNLRFSYKFGNFKIKDVKQKGVQNNDLK